MKTWGWPQYFFVAYYIFSIGVNLAKHGEPREGKFNFYAIVIGVVVEFLILKAGGFF